MSSWIYIYDMVIPEIMGMDKNANSGTKYMVSSFKEDEEGGKVIKEFQETPPLGSPVWLIS